ncbi:glycosyl transferase [Streptomyces pluripotens]|uniref:D-inositol 3-phosphate glycosyltransferase n=1 Tax=Streptomyces pluripotens TaxID=1355015 RepID=A0A221NXA7_9ACTN|nr:MULTISPECIES: glycosyltransferase [Streptomyces]ARP70298.1 glycosyl transferase [Streptomyces pluripotens]ASN24554.1 glycosyl transferase [Streptomyces pluripotens]KIE28073.1 glycosyl transferase [Streptomyces sp. MUSC 125]MCH0558400.1 glycosyltransferase [Streptomyces sp. MUM 16J]
MRALHIITGLGVGGAEQQLRLLLRHLPVDCDVVTLTNPGPVADGLVADGVRVMHLGMTGNRDLAALPRLARIIRRGRYDLVHTHLYRACLYGRIAARLAGVRAVVATEHSLGDSQMEGRPLTAGVRGLYLLGERLGRSTVAVSPTVAARLTRWGVRGQRVAVVPNGIDLPRFAFDPMARLRTRARLGLPADAFVIGGIGRLAPGKRFDVLLQAVARLPGDCWLLLVGGGAEEGTLRHAAREAGIADRVLFAGERPYVLDGSPGPDLPALTSAMDVLASPSPEEAFGLAVVEGLAAGLPVRYSSCPALEDLPPETAPDAMRVPCDADTYARALATVRTTPPGPRVAPEAARHYCITRSAARLMDVYTAALGPVVTSPQVPTQQGASPS